MLLFYYYVYFSCFPLIILIYANYFVHELWTEHVCKCFIYAAATFGHQPQPTFSSQTQAVAVYPPSTPGLGPQAGPPPYQAASNTLHPTLALLLCCHLAL